MPHGDLAIYQTQPPMSSNMEGLSLRSDVMYTNHKGEEKARIRKRQEKLLRKLKPALQRVLVPEESILFIARAQSPLSMVEQLTAGWWTMLLAASALVVTNKRILFFPVKRDGSWRESVRSLQWGDVESVKPGGFLARNVAFKFRNGQKNTYTNFRRADAKKLGQIALVMVPAASGEPSASHGMAQLCPDCRNLLTAGVYNCSQCGLIFKNEKTMVWRSIFLPGGGYFYTGHPLVGLLPALAEIYFIFIIVVIAATGLKSPDAVAGLIGAFTVLAFIFALETAVTILHCWRYIREFIPEKRDPSRAQSLSAGFGS